MAIEETRHKTRDTSVRLRRDGKGERVLFLHGAGGWPAWTPFLAKLAGQYEVLLPEHPGFGLSDNPPWIRNVGDLAQPLDADSGNAGGAVGRRIGRRIGIGARPHRLHPRIEHAGLPPMRRNSGTTQGREQAGNHRRHVTPVKAAHYGRPDMAISRRTCRQRARRDAI